MNPIKKTFQYGDHTVTLETGETRGFIEDGDTLTLRGNAPPLLRAGVAFVGYDGGEVVALVGVEGHEVACITLGVGVVVDRVDLAPEQHVGGRLEAANVGDGCVFTLWLPTALELDQ